MDDLVCLPRRRPNIDRVTESVWTRFAARLSMIVVGPVVAVCVALLSWNASKIVEEQSKIVVSQGEINKMLAILTLQIASDRQDAVQKIDSLRIEVTKDLQLRDHRLSQHDINFTRVGDRLQRLELLRLR